MSKIFLQKLRIAASDADDLLTSCDASDLLDGLEVSRDFMFEAANEIEQLESRLAQVERERDAALHDLKLSDGYECSFCKHTNLRDKLCAKNGHDCVTCSDEERCVCYGCTTKENKWQWRGVCAENSKGDADA